MEFNRGRILVRRQLEAVTGELREPKTEAGTRFVECPSFVMAELRSWWAEWQQRQTNWSLREVELCFPDSRGGPTDDRKFRTPIFYRALRRAGLRRVRVHNLRHTAASIMIASGADLAAISRQLGHATSTSPSPPTPTSSRGPRSRGSGRG